MKEKLEKQIFKNTIIFTLYIFILEIIIRKLTLNKIIGWPLLRILISSVIISLLISIIISLIKNKTTKKVFITITSFLIFIYMWAEVNFFFYLGFFMGAGNAEQGNKVLDYIGEYFEASSPYSYLMIIPFLLIILYYLFLKDYLAKNKLNNLNKFIFEIKSKNKTLHTYIISLFIIILLSITYYFTLKVNFMQNNLQSVKNISLFKYPENSNLSVSQFGTLVFGLTDLNSVIFKYNNNVEYIYVITQDEEPQTFNDYTRQTDDELWIELINNENKSYYNNLNTYFINREVTPKNEYTGIFKNKNLILILMESVNNIAINEEFFPNIYKLYNEGISFENNYSPRNNCSTGNNELTALTSLYSINNTCTANSYKRNTYPQSLLNHFNNIDYQTSSYHNYVEFYYSRRTIYPNLGSKIYRNASDLGIKWSGLYEEWPSDVDLIDASLPYFIDEDNFLAYMVTVTTHQPYGKNSEYGNKHLDNFSDYDYNIQLKRYLSKMTELDNAIGRLLETLEVNNKLDDTVIVLFGDHYPYGLSNGILNEILNYDLDNNEVDRTPLIIYNSQRQPEKITKYTSLIDIAPTLLNMWDMNYDPRLYLGNDIFSNYEDKVVFADGSWKNKHGFYSSTKTKFIYNDSADKEYTNEELIEINQEINLRQTMSKNAIKNNYFEYLEKELEELKKEKELLNQTNIIED